MLDRPERNGSAHVQMAERQQAAPHGRSRHAVYNQVMLNFNRERISNDEALGARSVRDLEVDPADDLTPVRDLLILEFLHIIRRTCPQHQVFPL